MKRLTYLYALDCGDIIYCGMAVNPTKRLHEHFFGCGAFLTRQKRPIALLGLTCVLCETGNFTREKFEREFASHIAYETGRPVSAGYDMLPHMRIFPARSRRFEDYSRPALAEVMTERTGDHYEI